MGWLHPHVATDRTTASSRSHRARQDLESAACETPRAHSRSHAGRASGGGGAAPGALAHAGEASPFPFHATLARATNPALEGERRAAQQAAVDEAHNRSA